MCTWHCFSMIFAKKDEQKTTRINSYNNIHQTHQIICDKYRGQEDLLPRIDKILVFLDQHDISNCPLDNFIIDEMLEFEAIPNCYPDCLAEGKTQKSGVGNSGVRRYLAR